MLPELAAEVLSHRRNVMNVHNWFQMQPDNGAPILELRTPYISNPVVAVSKASGGFILKQHQSTMYHRKEIIHTQRAK